MQVAFAGALSALGPFEPEPRLAVGVSGGADSMALALLADDWVRQCGGSLLALVVDHGLRQELAVEASATVQRLASRGIAARLLRISGLTRGSALAERARAARMQMLTAACAEAGILHLLLGHHAADQAETVLIRELGGSGPIGLAGMAPLVETPTVRILRPLLAMPPGELRQSLVEAGMRWVEDPSNADRSALRPRLRWLRRDPGGAGPATSALAQSAAALGRGRASHEASVAAELAEHVSLRPEGFAHVDAWPLSAGALAALVQTVAGTPFPPAAAGIAKLSGALLGGTLAGARLMPAGRMGRGWLLMREAAAMTAAVPALPGAVWDGRFRLAAATALPPASTLGAVGDDAPLLRRVSKLPSAILRTLPAIRLEGSLLAVPHLAYPDRKTCAGISMLFCPRRPAAPAHCTIGDA